MQRGSSATLLVQQRLDFTLAEAVMGVAEVALGLDLALLGQHVA